MLVFEMCVKMKENINTSEDRSLVIKELGKFLPREAKRLGMPFVGLVEAKPLRGQEAEGDFNYSVVVGAGVDLDNICLETLNNSIKEHLNKLFKNEATDIEFYESTVPILMEKMRQSRFLDRKKVEGFWQHFIGEKKFNLIQYLADKETLTLEEALARARNICGDRGYLREIRRIYADSNEKRYAGHPVHYKITATKTEMAQAMVDLLVQCLYTNERLIGTRVDILHNISPESLEGGSLEKTVHRAHGATLVVDTAYCYNHEENTGADEQISRSISSVLKQDCEDTLVILVEHTTIPGFTEKLQEMLQPRLTFVELQEGKMSTLAALRRVEKLIKKSDLKNYYEPASLSIPERKEGYHLGDVVDIYKDWRSAVLRGSVYKAYKDVAKPKAPKASHKAYDELMEMIGLTHIKSLVKQLLATHKINQSRQRAGLKNQKQALHMLFSGNAGSAKTTVARLLTQIMAEEGIIRSNKLVECSRADIVGKYVGWTADLVKSKFEEALGGVLFIDEAYALIGEGNDFGREAINTMVQLMENHREDVVVIFAGYPEKMHAFIEQNEGLRSRISFALDFPDYTSQEMLAILELMTSKQDYELTSEAVEKCQAIFKKVSQTKNFGNGRFVRNMMEQAIMKQAVRLSELQKKKYSEKELKTLCAEDFTYKPSVAELPVKKMGLVM